MKRTLLFLLALAIAAPASYAAPRRSVHPAKTRPQVRTVSDAGFYSHLAQQWKDARKPVRITTVGDNRSARAFIVPAAGSVRGAGNTFFRSDVTFVNYDDTAQDIAAFWLPQGATNANPANVVITLEPGTFVTYEDFVGTVLHQSGLGSIFVIPVSGGDIDLDGAIDGFSRIWTNQPNATGTVSQPFPPVDPDSFYYHDVAASLGLRHDNAYRTNYGIVNADSVPHTFVVEIVSERNQPQPFNITVPGPGMVQNAIPAGDYGSLAIVFTVDDIEASWTAYASSTDNITGDGWVSIAAAAFTPADLSDIGQ